MYENIKFNLDLEPLFRGHWSEFGKGLLYGIAQDGY
jgi:hypothetical protein